MKLHIYSIRTRLMLALLVIGILPAIAIALFSDVNLENSLLASGSTHVDGLAGLEAIAELKVQRINAFYHNRVTDADALKDIPSVIAAATMVIRSQNNKDSPEYQAGARQLYAVLKEFLGGRFVEVLVADRSGNVVYATDPEAHELGKNLKDSAVFKAGLEKVTIGDIRQDPDVPGHVQQWITGPLASDGHNGKDVIGEMIFEIYVDQVFAFVGDLTGLGNTGESHIAKNVGDGALYISPLRFDGKAAFSKKIVFGDTNATAIQNAVQKGKDGAGVITDYRGKQTLAVWRHIDQLNWGLVTKIDEKEVFMATDKALMNILLLVGVLSLLIAVASLIITNSIVKPIVNLTTVATNVSKGKLDTKLTSINSQDEIGDLARAFDRLLVSLKLAMRGTKPDSVASAPIADKYGTIQS